MSCDYIWVKTGDKMGGLGHSALLRTLPFRSLNRSGSLTLAQISQDEISHIPEALGEIISRRSGNGTNE